MSERLNANPENTLTQNATSSGWDSLSEVPFRGSQQNFSQNEQTNQQDTANINNPPYNSNINPENIKSLRLSDAELIQLTTKWNDVKINQSALQEATRKNGNPNVHSKGLFFKSGNLPMSDDSVYRHVGTSAISDLMAQGFVRNKRESANSLDKPGKSGFGTIGASVYWYNGDSRYREKADLVIQASKSAAENGYVTKDDIQGIWVTDGNTGQPINLIDGRDHTSLEIADHKL